MGFLLSNYNVVSVTHDDCNAAMAHHIDDFEDALVAVCTQNAGADYIVTRDAQFLLAVSSVRLISPKNFVALL